MLSEHHLLILSSVSIAVLHTVSGPDHYIPFIALSKSKQWSIQKTVGWTILCGLGHVGSSVLLGLAGASIGWNLDKILSIENIRGGIAGWAFCVFGFIYMMIGLINANRNKKHKHFETDTDGAMYVFEHNHGSSNLQRNRHRVTPWVIFIIFLLGPCEPMIPLLFAPAVTHSFYRMFTLIMTYTFFTLLVMVSMVMLGYKGIAFTKTEKLEKHIHTIAGATILICGIGMLYLGW